MHRKKTITAVPLLLASAILLTPVTGCRSTEEEPVAAVEQPRYEQSVHGEGLSEYEFDNMFTEPRPFREGLVTPVDEVRGEALVQGHGDGRLVDPDDGTLDVPADEVVDFGASPGEDGTPVVETLDDGHAEADVATSPKEEAAEGDGMPDGVSIAQGGWSYLDGEEPGTSVVSGPAVAAGETGLPEVGGKDAYEPLPDGTVTVLHEDVVAEPEPDMDDPSVLFAIGAERQMAANEREGFLSRLFSGYAGLAVFVVLMAGVLLTVHYVITFIWNGGKDAPREHKARIRKPRKGAQESSGQTVESDMKESVRKASSAYTNSMIGVVPDEDEQEAVEAADGEDDGDGTETGAQAAPDDGGRAQDERAQEMEEQTLETLLTRREPSPGEERYPEVLSSPAQGDGGLEEVLDTRRPPRPGEESYPEVLTRG